MTAKLTIVPIIGLSVHLNQVHKENLDQVENALPNRTGLEVEIFGMEGIPQEVLEQHRNRIVQTFYQAQEDRRVATGNPLPGQTLQNSRKPIKYETEEELLRRLAQYRTQKNDVVAPNEGAMDGVVHHHATQYVCTGISLFVTETSLLIFTSNSLAMPANNLPSRPTDIQAIHCHHDLQA